MHTSQSRNFHHNHSSILWPLVTPGLFPARKTKAGKQPALEPSDSGHNSQVSPHARHSQSGSNPSPQEALLASGTNPDQQVPALGHHSWSPRVEGVITKDWVKHPPGWFVGVLCWRQDSRETTTKLRAGSILVQNQAVRRVLFIPYFAEEESEAQREDVPALSHTASVSDLGFHGRSDLDQSPLT